MQQQQQRPLQSAQFNLLIVGLILFVLSLYAVIQVMKGGVSSLLTYTTIIGGIVWIVAGRRGWWIPIPLASSIGGLIWVGFRIYPHELAMLMAAAALIPALIINSRLFIQNRRPLGWIPYTLLGYLIIHAFCSLLIAKLNNQGGLGSILRVYVSAAWPVIFVIGFYKFGSKKLVPLAITLIYIALAFRVALGLYSYFFPQLLYIPAMRVFFVFSESGSKELRVAPLRLLIISLALMSAAHKPIRKRLHFLAVVFSAWILLLGSSRVTVGMVGCIPIIWMYIQRKGALLISAVAVAATMITAINANPDLLQPLPRATQRALSILIFEEKLDVQAESRMSDVWHETLFKIGKDRWLASPLNFTVGNRVHPFDKTFHSYGSDFYHRAHVAANITRYERALWTVVTTTGVIGGLLFLAVFYRLLRDPVRDLLKNRIIDFRRSVYFLALVNVLLWLVFSPVHGGFPGNELVWAGLACAMHEDHRRSQLKAKKSNVNPNSGTILPGR